jgi:two-component system, OmpR family, response regulator RpaB
MDNLAKKIALVVDDTVLVRQVIGRVLREVGYTVVSAGDGEEAINLARFHEPTLIILDVHMPKKDGITALRELRLDTRFKDVPVILLTASSDRETVKAGLELRVFDYIIKSDAALILSRLRELIEKL